MHDNDHKTPFGKVVSLNKTSSIITIPKSAIITILKIDKDLDHYVLT